METPLRFENSRRLGLAATLLRPEEPETPPVVALSHGWGSGKASARGRRIADALRAAGIASLLVDFTGHGESEGRQEESTLEDQEDDLRCAVDLLAAREDLGPIGVAGSSSGAAVAIAEAVRDPRVEALVLRAPSPAARFSQAARIEVPTLVIQGGAGPLLDRNRELAKVLTCEHRFVTVPGAGHLFEEPGTFDVVVRETVEWFRRWLAREKRGAGGQRDPGGLRIVESGAAPFPDRADAGRRLAERLQAYRGPETLVLGLPRGGAVVAEQIAQGLEAELDVFVSRKLRAPDQPELAVGALAEGDVVLWNEPVAAALRLGESERRFEVERVGRELAEHVAAYRTVRPRAEVKGRTVIVTDDGVATGSTLRAAIAALGKLGAERLVVALPGGPRDTLEEIAAMPEVDELIALVAPSAFYAVGQLYHEFGPISTGEVCDALRRARRGADGDGGEPFTRPRP